MMASHYKVGFWDGLINETFTSMDEAQALAAIGHGAEMRILLIPEDADITTITGDDWNDAPADCNADGPYRVPAGSIWVTLKLGAPWPGTSVRLADEAVQARGEKVSR